MSQDANSLEEPSAQTYARQEQVDNSLRVTACEDNGYPYEKLPTPTSIRLLEFGPIRDGKPRTAKMRIFDLNDHPVYTALSYTWGDRAAMETCVCDGHEVKITQNLAAFLKRYKGDGMPPTMWYEHAENIKPFKSTAPSPELSAWLNHAVDILRTWPPLPNLPHWIWIDSLCIDQKNSLEVNQQIPLMGDIYRKASYVNVWLGGIDEETASSAIRVITLLAGLYWPWKHSGSSLKRSGDEWIAIHYHARRRLKALWGAHPRDFSHGYQALQAPPFQDINHLLEIFDHPWFTRAWTYQESRLASRKLINFGPYCLQTYHLQAALCSLWYCIRDRRPPAEGRSRLSLRSALRNMKRVFYAVKRSTSKDLLHREGIERRISWKIAQDVLKDRTMLRCCDGLGNKAEPEPNELSLFELLIRRRAAQCTVQRDLVYSLLGLASDGAKIRPNVTDSWQEVFIETVAHLIQTWRVNWVFTQASDQLEAAELPSWVPDWRFLWNWNSLNLDERHQPCPGEFQRSITISTCHRRLLAKGYIEDVVDEVWNLQADVHIPDKITSEVNKHERTGFIRGMTAEGEDARIFTTRRGRIGRGCSRAEPGDEIAVIYGVCRSLMMRRSRPEQPPDRNESSVDGPELSELYRYIGECYIYSGSEMKPPCSYTVDKNLEPILPEGREEQIIVIE